MKVVGPVPRLRARASAPAVPLPVGAMGRGGRSSVVVRHGMAVASVPSVAQAAGLMLKLQEGYQAIGVKAGTQVCDAEEDKKREGPSDGSLESEAALVLRAAVDITAALGGATLAQGLQKLRVEGRHPPAHDVRRWRAVDEAASLLRHPGSCEQAVTAARRWVGHREASETTGT